MQEGARSDSVSYCRATSEGWFPHLDLHQETTSTTQHNTITHSAYPQERGLEETHLFFYDIRAELINYEKNPQNKT
jgi:hypothetical protein